MTTSAPTPDANDPSAQEGLAGQVVEVGAYAQQKEATARAVNEAARMAQVAARRTRELAAMTARAESATADLAALVAGIEGLADEWEAGFFAFRKEDPAHIRIRALLAESAGAGR